MDLALERTNTLTHARTVLDGAKSANRELTDGEQALLTADMGRVKELDKQLKGRAMVDSVKRLGGEWQDEDHTGRSSIFTPEAKAGIANAARTRTAYRTDVDSKALITTSAMLPTSGTGVEPGLHPGSQYPLASLFPNQPADGPVQRYYRMTSGTAAVVAEGGLKPDAGVAIAAVDLALTKLACTANFSDEMSQDAAFLVDFLSREMAAAVAAAENGLILSTFGTTSGVVTATGTLVTVVDLVADAIASMESISGITPSAIIANPTVISAIRKSKAATSGVYNVDILSTTPTVLHGVRLISTPEAPVGTIWLASPTGVVIYRRGGVTFEVGLDGSDFTHNTRTARSEERIAVAVTRPTSLFKLVVT